MTDARSTLVSALRVPTYRKVFAAQVIALLGTGLATIALGLLAFDLAGAAAGEVLGTALAVKMIVYVTVSPLAGAHAARWPRTSALVALDLVRALAIGSIVFVTAVWQVYVLIAVVSACAAAFTPIFQATIPSVLPDSERYTAALSLSRLAYDLENLLSPLLAAALLMAVTIDALFAANTLAFLASAALVGAARLPERTHRTEHGGTSFGLREYAATPRLRALFCLSSVAALGGALAIVNTVVIVQGELGLAATSTALALGAFGAGSMLVALALPRLLRVLEDRSLMLAGPFVVALGAGLAVGVERFAWLLPTWFVLGVGVSLVQTPAARLLLRSSREDNRTALFAAQFALSHLGWLLAYVGAGWGGSLLGLPAVFMAASILSVLLGLAAVWIWRGGDATTLYHEHAAVEHEHLHVHGPHHQHLHDGSEGPEPHSHPHRHEPLRHEHEFVIDPHHLRWPNAAR
ncbi:MAG: MFS transporter [Pseudomonadota bacterium]